MKDHAVIQRQDHFPSGGMILLRSDQHFFRLLNQNRAVTYPMDAVCNQTIREKSVTVPNAGNGLAFSVDKKAYLEAPDEFFGPEASVKTLK